jgi:hypothetical protein
MSLDDFPAAVPSPDVGKLLINGLSAYGRLYGLPNSPEQVQGILGTLLRLHQPDRPAAAIDAIAQQVLADLTPEALKNALVDRASSALAKQAHHWQQQLEQDAITVLSTYVERYAPPLTPDRLHTMATAVLPLLDEGPVTGSEALGLISHLVQTFDPSSPLVALADSPLGALAERLATSLGQQSMAEAVGDTVMAYVETYAPALTAIGSDLISQALSAVLNNQVDFGLDVDLAMVDKALLIQQVSFQLNILKPSRQPSKTAAAIAAEVDAAVRAYQDRPDRPPVVDVTTGVSRPGGVSSSWTSTRLPNPDAPGDTSASPEDFWERHQPPAADP